MADEKNKENKMSETTINEVEINGVTYLDDTHPFNKEELMEIVSFLTSLDADL